MKNPIQIGSRKLIHKETMKEKKRKREHISKTGNGYPISPEHLSTIGRNSNIHHESTIFTKT